MKSYEEVAGDVFRRRKEYLTKKRICVSIAVVLLVAIAVCTLPFPQRVKLTLQAKAYTREGVEYVEDVSVVVKGYWLHYLLRGTQMKITLDIDGDDTLLTYRQSVPVFDLQNGVQFISFLYYDGRTNAMDAFNFVFNDAFTAFAIGLDGRADVFYVASTQPDADLQALALEFKAAGNWFH